MENVSRLEGQRVISPAIAPALSVAGGSPESVKAKTGQVAQAVLHQKTLESVQNAEIVLYGGGPAAGDLPDIGKVVTALENQLGTEKQEIVRLQKELSGSPTLSLQELSTQLKQAKLREAVLEGKLASLKLVNTPVFGEFAKAQQEINEHLAKARSDPDKAGLHVYEAHQVYVGMLTKNVPEGAAELEKQKAILGSKIQAHAEALTLSPDQAKILKIVQQNQMGEKLGFFDKRKLTNLQDPNSTEHSNLKCAFEKLLTKGIITGKRVEGAECFDNAHQAYSFASLGYMNSEYEKGTKVLSQPGKPQSEVQQPKIEKFTDIPKVGSARACTRLDVSRNSRAVEVARKLDILFANTFLMTKYVKKTQDNVLKGKYERIESDSFTAIQGKIDTTKAQLQSLESEIARLSAVGSKASPTIQQGVAKLRSELDRLQAEYDATKTTFSPDVRTVIKAQEEIAKKCQDGSIASYSAALSIYEGLKGNKNSKNDIVDSQIQMAEKILSQGYKALKEKTPPGFSLNGMMLDAVTPEHISGLKPKENIEELIQLEQRRLNNPEGFKKDIEGLGFVYSHYEQAVTGNEATAGAEARIHLGKICSQLKDVQSVLSRMAPGSAPPEEQLSALARASKDINTYQGFSEELHIPDKDLRVARQEIIEVDKLLMNNIDSVETRNTKKEIESLSMNIDKLRNQANTKTGWKDLYNIHTQVKKLKELAKTNPAIQREVRELETSFTRLANAVFDPKHVVAIRGKPKKSADDMSFLLVHGLYCPVFNDAQVTRDVISKILDSTVMTKKSQKALLESYQQANPTSIGEKSKETRSLGGAIDELRAIPRLKAATNNAYRDLMASLAKKDGADPVMGQMADALDELQTFEEGVREKVDEILLSDASLEDKLSQISDFYMAQAKTYTRILSKLAVAEESYKANENLTEWVGKQKETQEFLRLGRGSSLLIGAIGAQYAAHVGSQLKTIKKESEKLLLTSSEKTRIEEISKEISKLDEATKNIETVQEAWNNYQNIGKQLAMKEKEISQLGNPQELSETQHEKLLGLQEEVVKLKEDEKEAYNKWNVINESQVTPLNRKIDQLKVERAKIYAGSQHPVAQKLIRCEKLYGEGVGREVNLHITQSAAIRSLKQLGAGKALESVLQQVRAAPDKQAQEKILLDFRNRHKELAVKVAIIDLAASFGIDIRDSGVFVQKSILHLLPLEEDWAERLKDFPNNKDFFSLSDLMIAMKARLPLGTSESNFNTLQDLLKKENRRFTLDSNDLHLQKLNQARRRRS